MDRAFSPQGNQYRHPRSQGVALGYLEVAPLALWDVEIRSMEAVRIPVAGHETLHCSGGHLRWHVHVHSTLVTASIFAGPFHHYKNGNLVFEPDPYVYRMATPQRSQGRKAQPSPSRTRTIPLEDAVAILATAVRSLTLTNSADAHAVIEYLVHVLSAKSGSGTLKAIRRELAIACGKLEVGKKEAEAEFQNAAAFAAKVVRWSRMSPSPSARVDK